jgi:hypothetical protein
LYKTPLSPTWHLEAVDEGDNDNQELEDVLAVGLCHWELPHYITGTCEDWDADACS